jgi:DNA-binding LacI/PurR family transcriptional regulator
VPEDVAVTGGGSLRAYSWYFAASLTSMDHDQATVARLVCDLFKRLRRGDRIEPGHVERVPCRLVEGETTARK